MSVLLEVHGMSCAHCVAAITSAVSPLPGVTAVDVALDAGTVRVEGTPDVVAVRPRQAPPPSAHLAADGI